MKRIILLTLLIPVLAHAQRYGHTSGSTFYWNKSGEAQKSDSIRYIQGSNITLTQSGNTLTIAGAAGAGSTANVRANTGWTAQGGATATDTVVTYLLWNGKYQRAMFVDTDNDSIVVAPHALFPLVGKDGTLLLFAFDSTGRMGLNAATAAQATRAFMNVLGRAANDTLAIWSNEGNTSATGDSVVYILPNGAMSISSTTLFSGLASDARLKVGGGMCVEGNSIAINGANAQIQLNSSAQRIYYDATNKMQFYVAGAAAHVMDDNGYVGINNGGLKSRNQGVLTVRGNGTTDSLAVFRNDKNATLDSTAIILKDGSFVTGEWRIRSGADSLVFHHDGVPVFAILPDGTTADLVAGTPPTLWRNIPPQEYIWLLRIGVLLLLLLVAFKVYDYAKPRIKKHKTLPGEI